MRRNSPNLLYGLNWGSGTGHDADRSLEPFRHNLSESGPGSGTSPCGDEASNAEAEVDGTLRRLKQNIGQVTERLKVPVC